MDAIDYSWVNTLSWEQIAKNMAGLLEQIRDVNECTCDKKNIKNCSVHNQQTFLLAQKALDIYHYKQNKLAAHS